MSFTTTYITPRAWRASEHPRTRDRLVRIDDLLMSPDYPELRSDYGRGGHHSRRNVRTAFRHVIEQEALYSTDIACLEPDARDRWGPRAEMLHGILDRGCNDVIGYQAPHFVRMCDERANKHDVAARRCHRLEDMRYHRRLATEWRRLANKVAQRLDAIGWFIEPSGPVYVATPAYVVGGGGSTGRGAGRGGGSRGRGRGYNPRGFRR